MGVMFIDNQGRRRELADGFFIQPASCRGYDPAVISGAIIDRNGTQSLIVHEPYEFRKKWPTVSMNYLRRVSDEVGLPRIVENVLELDSLLAAYKIATPPDRSVR